MITQAFEQDRARILEYVNDKPCENLFISGDIMQYGFDTDFQKVWIDETDRQMKGVYLLFRTNLCVYMRELDGDFEALRDLIASHDVKCINAIKPLAEKLSVYVPQYKLRHTHIAVCDSDEALADFGKAEKAELSDIEELTRLRMLCFPEDARRAYESIYESVEMVLRDFNIFMLRDNGKIAAMGYSNAQSDKAGMICSVCTHPDYRNKGYASMVVSATVSDLLNHGKKACLFFDNPAAASIYHKIGFKDINEYTMMMSE